MQLQLAPLIGASTRGGGEGARLYTAMAAVTVMFSPHREINGTVLDHRLHARAAEQRFAPGETWGFSKRKWGLKSGGKSPPRKQKWELKVGV